MYINILKFTIYIQNKYINLQIDKHNQLSSKYNVIHSENINIIYICVQYTYLLAFYIHKHLKYTINMYMYTKIII